MDWKLWYADVGLVRAWTPEGIDISCYVYEEDGRAFHFNLIGKRDTGATDGVRWFLVVPKTLSSLCATTTDGACHCAEVIGRVWNRLQVDPPYYWFRGTELDASQHACTNRPPA